MPSLGLGIGLSVARAIDSGEPPINLPAGIDQITITATGTVKFFGGSVALVECLSGTAVQLQIYDNPYAAIGSAIYDVTMDEDDQASPTFFAVNGMWAVITGTGTFRLTLNND